MLLLIINVIGYLLLSFLLLKNVRRKNLWISTAVLTGTGLLLWVTLVFEKEVSPLFSLYHIAGVSSGLWLDSSYGGFLNEPSVQIGFLFSVVPSLLIVTGFYLSEKWNSMMLVRASGYMICMIAAIVLTFFTGYQGRWIENRGQLKGAFPMDTGFPLSFAQLNYPEIDPPLPYYYGGSCCTMSVISPLNYWISAAIVFFLLLILFETVWFLVRKRENRME